MKTLFKLVPFLGILLLFSSCSDDDTGFEDIYGSDEFYVTARVDDENYEVRGEMLCLFTYVAGTMNITSAYPDASKQITLSIVNYQGPGTYPIDISGDYFAAGQYAENNVTYASIYSSPYGMVKIIEHDNEAGILEGEFVFKGSLQNQETTKLVSGEFRCNSYENLEF